jgi:hypothetical protein
MSSALKAKMVRACVAGSAHCLPTLDFTMSANGQMAQDPHHEALERQDKGTAPAPKPL